MGTHSSACLHRFGGKPLAASRLRGHRGNPGPRHGGRHRVHLHHHGLCRRVLPGIHLSFRAENVRRGGSPEPVGPARRAKLTRARFQPVRLRPDAAIAPSPPTTPFGPPMTARTRCVAPSSTRGISAGSTATPSHHASRTPPFRPSGFSISSSY